MQILSTSTAVPKGGSRVTELKDLYLRISDLLIDSASQYDRIPLILYQRIFMQNCSDINRVLEDGNYNLQFSEFKASTAGRICPYKGLSPAAKIFSEMEFARRFKYQKDRYSGTL
jgi:hypothetical protein